MKHNKNSVSGNLVADKKTSGKPLMAMMATQLFRTFGWLVALMLSTSLVWGVISTSVNRNQMDLTDTLSLTVQVDDQANIRRPDFNPLNQDWRILGTNRQTDITFSNGQLQSKTIWHLTLAPKREGRLSIPVLVWNNSSSRPIAIQVTPIAADVQEQLSKLAFFQTSVSGNAVWIQSQILYRVALYYSQETQLKNFPAPPNLPNAIVQALETPSPNIELISGVRYWVIRQSYAIFPQASGTLKLPPEQSTGYAHLAGYGNTRKRIEVRSQGHLIKVLPRAANYPPKIPWLPAKKLQVTGTTTRSVQELEVGTTANLSLTIEAEGLPGSLLPQLPPFNVPGVRIYSNPPTIQESLSPQGVISTLTSNLAMIPVKPGMLELPPVHITWWDADEARTKRATWPGWKIRIVPSTSTLINTDGLDAEGTPGLFGTTSSVIPRGISFGFWSWISLVFALAWLSTLWYVWHLKQRFKEQFDQPAVIDWAAKAQEAKNFHRLIVACQKKDAADIYQCLSNWARCKRPESGGQALNVLLQDDSEGQALVQALNQHLYLDSSLSFDAAAILGWAKNKRTEASQPEATQDALAPLYPVFGSPVRKGN